MKTAITKLPIRSCSSLATGLAGAFLVFVSAAGLHAQTPKSANPAPVDPATHAAHVASGTMPAMTAPDAAKGDAPLAQQISQLRAKVAQLEATLAKNMPAMPAASAPMPGMPGMSPAATPAPPMAGMSAPAAPTSAAMPMPGMMGMMGMMDKMMGMMDKMMPMDPAAPMPAGGGGMAMGMDKMKMGAMPAPAPSDGMSKMSGGGMMDMMDMMGMMGMSGGGSMAAMPQSALPGFPGASHLYHIGGTGFFLDHPQHITLTTEQQAALNKAKEQALLAKSTADRAIEQAEQGVWTLTAADQPDAAKIEAKLREVEKLRADERLAFIRAVGEASKILTDEQRKSLTGFAPPAAAAPAAAPMAAMKNM